MNQEKQTALINSLLDVAAAAGDDLPQIYLNPEEFSLFVLSWDNGSISLFDPRPSERSAFRFNGMEISKHLDVKPGWFGFERQFVPIEFIRRWKNNVLTPIWRTMEFDADFHLQTRKREIALLQFWVEKTEK